MRIAFLSILIGFLGVSTAFGQRDSPVWDSYLPQISIYHEDTNKQGALTIDFLFKKNGGPHEHTEHQAYVLVYLKKDEEQIMKLAADPELIKKKNEKTKVFLDLLVDQKLVVPVETKVAKINGETTPRFADDRGTFKRTGVDTLAAFSFPFKFTLTYEKLFQSVQKLGNFNVQDVNDVGKSTWYKDKFKLMVLIPVNDSRQATKVSAKIRENYDFAAVMNFETSLLYFRPLPYEFEFKKYEDTLTIYIY
jgi:hypothetical protein